MFKLHKSLLVSHIVTKVPTVKLIYLFGSMVTGQQHENSDLDIAILPAPALDNLERWQIAQDLACEFDINVDLVDLNVASTVLCQQVITTGELLWGSQVDVSTPSTRKSTYHARYSQMMR